MAQGPSTGSAQRLPAAAGLVAALLAASCCLLPLTLIALGGAGDGLMMTMMSYEWLTLPLGVFGLPARTLSIFETCVGATQPAVVSSVHERRWSLLRSPPPSSPWHFCFVFFHLGRPH